MIKIKLLSLLISLSIISTTYAALTDNIVVYYKLDNTSDSVGTNTLTNNGTVTFSTGKIGNGAYIDAYAALATKFLSVASDLGITGGAMSINCWYYPTGAPSSGQYHAIASQGDSGTFVNQQIQYKNTGGTLGIWFNRQRQNVANDGPTYNVTLTTGTWYMITYTYDGSNINGYLNASLVAGPTASTGNGASGVTDYFYLGAIRGNGTNENQPNGRIDECGVWTRAITASEISQLYNSGTGLQYPFSTTANTTPQFMGFFRFFAF